MRIGLTLALSLRSCMEGSFIDLPEAALVQFIKSPRAEATSLTALMTITWESGWEEPREQAPRFTASASWAEDDKKHN